VKVPYGNFLSYYKNKFNTTHIPIKLRKGTSVVFNGDLGDIDPWVALWQNGLKRPRARAIPTASEGGIRLAEFYLRQKYRINIHKDFIQLWTNNTLKHFKKVLLDANLIEQEVMTTLYSYLTNEYFEWLFTFSDNNITEEKIAENIDLIKDSIFIDNIVVSDKRCDVGSIQTISLHGKWMYNNSNIEGSIFVNGTEHVVNETGWVTFRESSDSVCKKTWVITGFSYPDVKNYVIVKAPWIIWDRIQIISVGVSKDSTIVGKFEKVWFKAVYEYDNKSYTSLKGLLYINDEPLRYSSLYNRWEKNVSSDKPETTVSKITKFEDYQYELTEINDIVGSQILSWERPIWELHKKNKPHSRIIVSYVFILIFFLRQRGYIIKS